MRWGKEKGSKETETLTCECGAAFEATVTVYGGQRYGNLKYCSLCQGKWEAEEARQEELRQHDKRRTLQQGREDFYLEGANFPHRFINKGWDGKEEKEVPWTGYDRSQNPKVWAQVLAWLRRWAKQGAEGMPSLVLQGGYGSGKTHLAVAIGVCLCRLWGVTDRRIRDTGILFTTASDFGVRLRSTYRNGSEESEADVYDGIEKARLVILDDVGDPTKEKDSDATRRQYFEIINRRYNADRPIIITLNFRLGKDDVALMDFFSPAVYSRLVEMSKGWVVDLGNKDRRRHVEGA